MALALNKSTHAIESETTYFHIIRRISSKIFKSEISLFILNVFFKKKDFDGGKWKSIILIEAFRIIIN